MKTLSLFLVGCFAALSVFAQNLSTVTITVNGTRNKQVLVDGQSYTVNNDINNVNTNVPISITNLQPGQHKLQVVRANQFNNNTNNTTTFNLRGGYNMDIIINSNGGVQLNEVRKKRSFGINQGTKSAMSDADFNELYNDILGIRSSSGRTTAVTNVFANQENYFTTKQARQLIQLVTSQTSRLKLAKASYSSITDPVNFTQLNNLLNSKAHRNDLAAYVKKYNANNPGNNTGSVTTPMSDANFSIMYKEAQQLWPASSKLTYLNNVFANTGNYFSTYQVRQLIQLLNAETDRLQIAKVAYRSITDKASFNQIYDLLSTQSARNDLASYVSTYNANFPGVQTAMSTTQFNSINAEAQQQYSSSARVTYLSNVFANTGNYFTTAQARQLVQLVSDEPSRLYLAKLSYRGIVDRSNFTVMINLLNSQASRNELATYVSTYNGGTPVITTRLAMSDTEFNTLSRDVSNQFGLGVKMGSLTDIFNNANYNFSTAQARHLIQLVSSETNRLQLAKASYDNIVDPANFSQLYDILASQASRDELSAYVRTQTNSGYGTIKTPVSDASFNSLYNDISNQFGLGVKMSSLTDVFNNTSYYFTTAQARQLIQLVSSESNRLQLAKASYDNITDPENFSLINDVLATQASRNELAAFVNSYSYNR